MWEAESKNTGALTKLRGVMCVSPPPLWKKKVLKKWKE